MNRRIKLLPVSHGDLLRMLLGKLRVRLPEGVEIRSVYADYERHALTLVLESDSFDEVPVDECAPVLVGAVWVQTI